MDGQKTRLAPPERLQREPTLKLDASTVKGPFSFLNATQAQYRHNPKVPGDVPPNVAKAHDIVPSKYQYKYTSRNDRKGRHALVVAKDQPDNGHLVETPKSTRTPSAIARGILRMFTCYPWWDVSWLVAVTFTLGSAVWVVNAFFALLPDTWPSGTFPGEVLYGGGISAFIGVNIFEIGSILLILEAFNTNSSASFGWALEQLYEDEENRHSDQDKAAVVRVKPQEVASHHHRRKSRKGADHSAESGQIRGPAPGSEVIAEGDKSWIWWPSWQEVRDKHSHDLGFWACCIQLAAASVFWVAGLTALPGISNKMTEAETVVLYWTPQVVGGLGFVISGYLFMIETQKRWWLPALDVLGWHIGFWNCIGGIGFMLCPCFGYSSATWAQLQASVSTFWGSWAFLIGSALQWYESLEKRPVEVKKLHQN